LIEHRRILWIAQGVPEEADAEGTVKVMFCWMVDLLKRLLFVIIRTVTSGFLVAQNIKIIVLGT
jgi:hypothetical protein